MVRGPLFGMPIDRHMLRREGLGGISQQGDELVHGEPHVRDDRTKGSGLQVLAGMHGDNNAAAI